MTQREPVQNAMPTMYDGFIEEQLDGEHAFFRGQLPARLIPDAAGFDELWSLHPEAYHEIMIHGRLVKTPRWQQAYDKDYHYTMRTNRALPTPGTLQPFLEWAKEAVDPTLNGLLLNWYDGRLGHSIGKHRDSTKHLIEGAPIVTISLGEERIFRLRPWKRQGLVDFVASNGTVFIMPYATNLAWTHEVRRAARYRNRRISVTLRAFE